VASGYTGTVHFTSSDALAVLPANYTFTATDAGSHTFTVTLKTDGTDSISVADLTTPTIQGSASVTISPGAAGGFTVSGLTSPVTAGASDTFTLQAVDAYGNPVTSYSGTVHFTSSDPKAVLPANSTLTNGKGTFSVTFETAGTQSVTATSTTSSGIAGTESGITVNPAAAASLAFLQQPTTNPAGSAISPTVTVEELDRFGNVVTTDNTDQVTLSLGANPGGATLSGGGPVTVSHGVATFAGLAVSTAGTGYTLVAHSGALTAATSAAFTITAASPSGTLLEGFENGLSNYWVYETSYPEAFTSTAAAHDGSYGLDDPGDGDWYFRTDAAAQVNPGDTISAWVQLSTFANGRAYFGFGTSDYGTMSVVLAPNTDQFIIQNNAGFGYTNLAAVSQTYAANEWYHVVVEWGTSVTVVAELFSSNGQTLLNSVTAATGDTTPGGFAFRSTGYNTFFDTVTVLRGVNHFAELGSTGGSSVTSEQGSSPTLPSAGRAEPSGVAVPVGLGTRVLSQTEGFFFPPESEHTASNLEWWVDPLTEPIWV
jgi:hypothetical protein